MRKKTSVKIKGKKGYNTLVKIKEEYPELCVPGLYVYSTPVDLETSSSGIGYKMGCAETSVAERVFRQRNSVPSGQINLLGIVHIPDPNRVYPLEEEMHRHFEDYRIHEGEWCSGLDDDMIYQYLERQKGFLKTEQDLIEKRCRTKISTLFDGLVPIARFRPRCLWHPELTAQILGQPGIKEKYRTYSIEHLLIDEPKLIHHPSVIRTKSGYRGYASYRYHQNMMLHKRHNKQKLIVGTLEKCMS